jgi:glycosyltransferase involved in cell wall biosynthesis
VATGGAGIVYSGVDVERFAPQRRPAGDEHAPRILFVGGLSGGKGITDLLRVLGRLRQRFPHIFLRAIGKGTAEQIAAIDRLVAEHELQNHFERAGFVQYEKLPEHYAWCDFFAAPSVYEGGPGNVYLEAMACGRPVIACNTGGIPEVVEDRQSGLLVRPHNLDDLEEAVAWLSTSASSREEMGRQGRMRVAGEFSIESYLDKCEAHYRGLLS